MRQSVIALMFSLITACSWEVSPEREFHGMSPEAQSSDPSNPAVEQVTQIINTCPAKITEANNSLAERREGAQKNATYVLSRGAAIQAAIGENKIVSTMPIKDLEVGVWQDHALYTDADCNPQTGQLSYMDSAWKTATVDFDGSSAQVIAYALLNDMEHNQWVNIASDTKWSDTVLQAFRGAAVDHNVIATAGAAGRRIIPILDEYERGQIRSLVIEVLEGVDSGDGYHPRFPLTVTMIEISAKMVQATDDFKRDKLDSWFECAYPDGGGVLDVLGHYISYEESCGAPPTPPSVLIDEDGAWMLSEGNSSLDSIFIRRWLQVGGGQAGNYLIWTYRVWAVVYAHDLGLTSARAWAQEVKDEAANVGNGFGKKQYLAFLDEVIAAQNAQLLDEAGLAAALKSSPTPPATREIPWEAPPPAR